MNGQHAVTGQADGHGKKSKARTTAGEEAGPTCVRLHDPPPGRVPERPPENPEVPRDTDDGHGANGAGDVLPGSWHLLYPELAGSPIDQIPGILLGKVRIPLATNLIGKFWTRFEKADGDGCWIWKGIIEQNGYGSIELGGDRKKAGSRTRISAHRLSWILHNGPISSPTIFVCHKCDNPPCVRPDHLFLGTQRDNMRDASRKGRLGLLFCKRGHPMTGTVRKPSGKPRGCILCSKIHNERSKLTRQIKLYQAKLDALRDL